MVCLARPLVRALLLSAPLQYSGRNVQPFGCSQQSTLFFLSQNDTGHFVICQISYVEEVQSVI